MDVDRVSHGIRQNSNVLRVLVFQQGKGSELLDYKHKFGEPLLGVDRRRRQTVGGLVIVGQRNRSAHDL